MLDARGFELGQPETFGAINIPRVGMEVLITFLEGDPDQPLITGCLYHGANLPPYKLPDFKTLATVKSKEYKDTRTSKGKNITYCFWLFALFCGVAWIWIYVRVPETKGQSLEQIQRLWKVAT